MLVVLERATNKITGTFKLGQQQPRRRLRLGQPDRLVISIAEKFGALEQPQLDRRAVRDERRRRQGRDAGRLPRQRRRPGHDDQAEEGQRPDRRVPDRRAGRPTTQGRADLGGAVPSAAIRTPAPSAWTSYNGRARARGRGAGARRRRSTPTTRAWCASPRAPNADNIRKLYYRTGDGAEWDLMSIEKARPLRGRRSASPPTTRSPTCRSEQPTGPDAIVASTWPRASARKCCATTTSIRRRDHLPQRHARADRRVLHGRQAARTAFFDEECAGSAPAAQPGGGLRRQCAWSITSQTSRRPPGAGAGLQRPQPGRLLPVRHAVAKKAAHVLARREWFDPEQQSPMRSRSR